MDFCQPLVKIALQHVTPMEQQAMGYSVLLPNLKVLESLIERIFPLEFLSHVVLSNHFSN